jgi:hypothetical protein
MSWVNHIARQLFPRDQSFMARRKLRYAVWALLAGIIAAGLVVGIAILANNQRG